MVLADLPPAGVPDTPGAGRGGSSHGRHAQTRKPEPGWVPTAERYRDPSSGVIMRVWIDQKLALRHASAVQVTAFGCFTATTIRLLSHFGSMELPASMRHCSE